MRIGLVSDIHCQPEALAQAIAAMGAIDRLVCLGDAISQYRFCNTTVAMLRDRGALTIQGNHEQIFFAGPGRDRPGVAADAADWLSARPGSLDLTLAGRSVLVVHSTPWPSGHAYVAAHHPHFPRFAESGHDVVLYGHTHQPLAQRLGDTLVVNPGSTGEGRPTERGFVRSCAVLDLAAMEAEIIDLAD